MESENSKALLESAEEAVVKGNFSIAKKILSDLLPRAVKSYSETLRFSKLAGKLLKSDSRNTLRLKPVKFALLSSSTTAFLEPLLSYFALLKSMSPTLMVGNYGNWRQDILSPDSWLSGFAPDFIFIILNYRDFPIPVQVFDPERTAVGISGEIESFWIRLRKALPKAIIVQSDFDSPYDDSGALLTPKYGGRGDVYRRVSSELYRLSAQSVGVEILPVSELRARCGARIWEDARMWFHARQHPSMDALPVLAEYMVRIASAKLIPPKKVCVLDLDNTLWGGIIGEDGLHGIELGPPSARGEAFAAFQAYLKELKDRGILLCVCSKNNEDDAVLPFEKHDAMVLKKEDFICFSANWKPKSESILKMASDLNLGLDSFVFIDDNPAEVAEVKSLLPQVESLLLPDDPADFVSFLSRKKLFDVLDVSQDDAKKSLMYKQNIERERARAEYSNVDDFLKSLNMQCVCSGIDSANIARVSQLILKTNQFNLTTRRETERQIGEFASNTANYAKCFRLTDKFGDNGVVGVALASVPPNSGVLEIDSFLLSCRVLGRGLEDLMLGDICRFASEHGYGQVRGIYRQTSKNSQVSDFYPKHGFVLEGSSDSEIFYTANPKLIRIKTNIELVSK